jgi:hypothetical protein
MTRTLMVALLTAGTAMGWACGEAGRPATPPEGSHRTAVGAVASSRQVVRRCAALSPTRDIPVLCPTRLPHAGWVVRSQTLERGAGEYLLDLESRPRVPGEPTHVLAGGRRGRFSLETTADDRWPVRVPRPGTTCCSGARRDLGLIGATEGREPGTWTPVRLEVRRRTTVAGHPALLMTVASFPDGGVHGGHLAVVWNQRQAGYALSIHFDGGDDREQEALLLESAGAMSRS